MTDRRPQSHVGLTTSRCGPSHDGDHDLQHLRHTSPPAQRNKSDTGGHRAQWLTKRFGSVTAVDDVTLELEAGTVTGFLGPNGAGKTSTLRMLLGLVVPTAGSATFQGRRYVDLDEHARRRVGGFSLGMRFTLHRDIT